MPGENTTLTGNESVARSHNSTVDLVRDKREHTATTFLPLFTVSATLSLLDKRVVKATH